MTYLRNLFDLMLAHWLLRNLRREREDTIHFHVKGEIGNQQMFVKENCADCRKENTIHALETHVAELERMLK